MKIPATRILLPIPALTLVVALLALSNISVTGASEDDEPSVYLIGAPFQEEDGSDFIIVSAVASKMDRIYGFSLEISYNPAVVAVRDADPVRSGVQPDFREGFLGLDRVFEVRNSASNGIITVAGTLMAPSPPVWGELVLVDVEFDFRANSTSQTIIEIESVTLVHPDGSEQITDVSNYLLISRLEPDAGQGGSDGDGDDYDGF